MFEITQLDMQKYEFAPTLISLVYISTFCIYNNKKFNLLNNNNNNVLPGFIYPHPVELKNQHQNSFFNEFLLQLNNNTAVFDNTYYSLLINYRL